MSQSIQIKIVDAAYAYANYGKNATGWSNGYYEIYAAREGPKSGSRYFMSKIEFVAPIEAKETDSLQLLLTVSRGHATEFTSAILTTTSLTGQKIYNADNETLAKALDGYLSHCNGTVLEDQSPKRMSYTFSGLPFELGKTYYIYLRRRLDLPNQEKAEDTSENNGFCAFLNPIYSVRQREKTSSTFELPEASLPDDETGSGETAPSEKWGGLNSWLTGYGIGLATGLHPIFVRPPIGFFYRDGIELPPFADYNTKDFPYICCYKEPVTNSTFVCYISSVPFVAVDDTVNFNPSGAIAKKSTITLDTQSEWSKFEEIETNNVKSFTPLWTNEDIIRTEEDKTTVIFETYLPTPIYYREVKE